MAFVPNEFSFCWLKINRQTTTPLQQVFIVNPPLVCILYVCESRCPETSSHWTGFPICAAVGASEASVE